MTSDIRERIALTSAFSEHPEYRLIFDFDETTGEVRLQVRSQGPLRFGNRTGHGFWLETDEPGYTETSVALHWHSVQDLLCHLKSKQGSRQNRTYVQHQNRQIPSALSSLLAEIEHSKFLLELEDNWDGDGSPRIHHETWDRATAFLLQSSTFAWEKHHLLIAVPTIGPGPSGSIDLHWRLPDRELLLNVPDQPGVLARFYLDDGQGRAASRGEVRLELSDTWLLVAVAVE